MEDHRTEITHGLGLALASFLWVLGEYAAGLHTTRIDLHPYVTNVFAVIPIAILYRVLWLRRERLGGALPWATALKSGMLVSVIAGALGAPSMWLYTKINPGFFSTMVEHAVSGSHATRAEAEGAFNLQSYAVQATIFPVFAGLITTLIIAAILRRRAHPTPATA